jgi:purine nucleoside permease
LYSPKKQTMKLSMLFLLVVVACLVATSSPVDATRRKVRVMVITMFDIKGSPFGAETLRWVQRENLTEEIEVPGLSSNFPTVKCRPPSDERPRMSDICVVTTDIGYANAASSITALVFGNQFNFENTYFIIAGIAGVDPADGTLGSAAWSRWVVDLGLSHEIDAREMPAGWPYGHTGFGPVPPGVKPTRTIGNEYFRLNEQLLQKALLLTQNLNLSVNDRPSTIAYRALYPNAPANAKPRVIQCDSASVDTYWHGAILSQRANDWAALLTNGSSNYCMTDEEDASTLTALRRGAEADLLDFNRIAVLRTASNFDQPHPGQTPYESLTTSSGGFLPSLENAYLVGSTLAHNIIGNWRRWKDGVPA